MFNVSIAVPYTNGSLIKGVKQIANYNDLVELFNFIIDNYGKDMIEKNLLDNSFILKDNYFTFTLTGFNKKDDGNKYALNNLANDSSGILLDIDSGIRIDEFIEKFPYNCLIYKTISFTEELHKFRVVILYDRIRSIEKHLLIVTGFLDLLDSLKIPYDKSTGQKARRFVLPLNKDYTIIKDKTNIECFNLLNKGNEIKYKQKEYYDYKNNKNKNTNIDSDYRLHLLRILDKKHWVKGNRHNDIVSLIFMFKDKYGISGNETLDIIETHHNTNFSIDKTKLKNLLI